MKTTQGKKVSQKRGKEENHYISRLESLIDLAFVLGQQNDFQEALRLVTQNAADLVEAEISLIMMINPKTRQTVKTIFVHREDEHQKDYHFIHTNISGWVIKNNRSLISKNLPEDSRFQKGTFSKLPVKSAVCVPFRVEEVIIGTLLLMNTKTEAVFSEEDRDYLEKLAAVASPFLRNTQKIQEYFAAPIPKEWLIKKYQGFGLLGKSKKYIDLLNSIEAAARTDVRVHLEGQSGTGKELIAKAIHHLSSRSDNKFIAIDCGAISPNLMESELFGHVKGAFTGASGDRKGLMEEANNGTLFMDEIANLSLELQAKLLRVLQEGEIRPLGSNKARQIDVRIISTSRTSLHKLVNADRFREDLYYRLHVYPIVVPSLDERSEDIPVLIEYFLKKFASQQQKQIQSIHEGLLDYLKQRHWAGNIRELENFVERLVTLTPPDVSVIDTGYLPPEFQKEFKKRIVRPETDMRHQSLPECVAEYEAKLIRQALINHDWNQSKAARALKISEATIRYKMTKLGIKEPDDS
ncbi:MAG: GAF domain-containing protein [candidate division Zixibacteria bacterium]|nr:GAF domain-containing protein [candidate division Zixibacteria bacterium]